MNETRIIACDEVQNLRDFGGWKTKDGQQVRMGKLLRSGHWANAGERAHALLAGLGVQVFIDLRRPIEREQQPNILAANLGIKQFSSAGGDKTDPPHLQFLRAGNLSKASVTAYMHSAYRRIPQENQHHSLFRQTLLQLANGKTVLIHCAAGKDRTGILAALILALLEVEQETIMQDYLLTNKAVDVEGLLPSITAQFSERLGKEIAPDVLLPMLGVEADFLQKAQTVIGDPVLYAEQNLGLTTDDLSRLRQHLICPPG
ncbi:hypothetical protein MNBD_ALPHA06-144 [hydrothermal vent metagenome]|uniref:Tyrosine specific protein phosphatases domain-containing protein n=1 Tax=hydrothermal vent metagenome TaxID=652676 RepID=A0A3B0R282_9ZZZZ